MESREHAGDCPGSDGWSLDDIGFAAAFAISRDVGESVSTSGRVGRCGIGLCAGRLGIGVAGAAS